MRAILPELDLVRARGASVDECMAYLKTHGLLFPNPHAFSAALHRARKAGPLPDLIYPLPPPSGQPGSSTPILSHGSALGSVESENAKLGMPERNAATTHHGVPVVRSTIHESRTDSAHPRMKDLV